MCMFDIALLAVSYHGVQFLRQHIFCGLHYFILGQSAASEAARRHMRYAKSKCSIKGNTSFLGQVPSDQKWIPSDLILTVR